MAKESQNKYIGAGNRRDLLRAVTAVPGAALALRGANCAKDGASIPPSPLAARPQGEYDPQQLNPYALKSIPDLGDLVPDKKFIWADLRAFDNTSPGFGVPGYLDNLSFKPDAVFVLIAHADFVFLHNNLSTDATLESRFSVYGGPELAGQTWSRLQLKCLVDHMHKAGVTVLLGLMTMVPRDGQGWAGQNPEVMTVTSDGEMLPAVNPLKRFKDGQLFEDVFVANLRTTMQAYGFDGFQGADGFTHLRVPLQVADFSDDMIEQFLDYTTLELPADLSRRSTGDVRAIKARALWILSEQRNAWVRFWRQRGAVF